jgi:hypothetical protein
VKGFEISAFTACDKRSGLIWVEDAGLLRKGAFGIFGKKELLFAYDERRNSHAWDKLSRSNVGREVLVRSVPGSEIVLLGQFETSDSSYGGFGHLNAYSNKLILEDILSNE